MQRILLFVLLLIYLGTGAVSFAASSKAWNMIPTIYEDGKSCPNNCDAHVVFNLSHNGTRNALDPSSKRSAPKRCTIGEACKICFSADDASCMLAIYRGGGPEKGRFDFTPIFYEENCPKASLPIAFARQCRNAQPMIDKLKTQINCVAAPDHEKCKKLMQTAIKRKAIDDMAYEECRTLGQIVFNQKYSSQQEKQRSNECAYEKLRLGGPNSKGEKWRRLLDGACRPQTYAGKDGLDCCTGSLYAAAILGSECKGFFVNR